MEPGTAQSILLDRNPRNVKFDYFGCVLHAMLLEAHRHPDVGRLLNQVLLTADLEAAVIEEPGH